MALQNAKLTLHGLRAGGATESRHREDLSEFTQRKGRWASGGSMRVYLDQVGAALALIDLPAPTREKVEAYATNIYNYIPCLSGGVKEGESSGSWQLRALGSQCSCSCCKVK